MQWEAETHVVGFMAKSRPRTHTATHSCSISFRLAAGSGAGQGRSFSRRKQSRTWLVPEPTETARKGFKGSLEQGCLSRPSVRVRGRVPRPIIPPGEEVALLSVACWLVDTTTLVEESCHLCSTGRLLAGQLCPRPMDGSREGPWAVLPH